MNIKKIRDSFFQTHMIAVIVAFSFLLICLFSYLINTNNMMRQYRDQQQQLIDLQNEEKTLKEELAKKEAMLLQESTGLSVSRVESDNIIAEDFVKRVLTWPDGATYDAIRDSVIIEYQLSENSRFIKEFLPVNVKTEDGLLNYIDTHHYNCRYESMTTYVSSIGTDVYSYVSFVTWSTADMGGNESTNTCVFTYDVNADGVLSNLDAYVTNN